MHKDVFQWGCPKCPDYIPKQGVMENKNSNPEPDKETIVSDWKPFTAEDFKDNDEAAQLFLEYTKLLKNREKGENK